MSDRDGPGTLVRPVPTTELPYAGGYCVSDVGGERRSGAWIYDALDRRDDVTPFEVYGEDIVFDLSHARRADLLMKPVFEGHEGVREFWREAFLAWGDVKFEVEELIDAGDRVLAVIHERFVGRASGVPVETSHLAVYTLADSKVTQLQVFDEREPALEAAGLSE